MNKKQEAIEKLKNAHSFDDFIAIAKEYEIPAENLGEFLPPNIMRNFFILKHYSDLDCVDILETLKANAELSNQNYSDEIALQTFLGWSEAKAKMEISYSKEMSRIRGEELGKALADAVKKSLDDDNNTEDEDEDTGSSFIN